MAFPGSKSCKPRPECIHDYDFIPIFTPCQNNQRKLIYTWRNDTICDKDSYKKVEPERTMQCEVCEAGKYINKQGLCKECPEGEFSSQKNSLSCKPCNAGHYAPKLKSYIRLENFPNDIETTCERSEEIEINPCEIIKGWITYKGFFSVPPYVPIGTILILRKIIDIVGNEGSLEFAYQLEDETESLKIIIDGVETKLNSKTSNKSANFKISQGDHIVEWVYTKIANEEGKTHAMIIYINIKGSTQGSGTECLNCPKGFVSLPLSSKCTRCPPGTTPNEFVDLNNSLAAFCERCPLNTYRNSIMDLCAPCPIHTRPNNIQSDCELFDGYEINSQYLFTLAKFDSHRTLTANEIYENLRSGSFLGSFYDDNENAYYFFSPKIASVFDSNLYEYTEDGTEVTKGYIFELIRMNDVYDIPYNEERKSRSYYRKKRNLGSKLKAIDPTNWEKGEITIEYEDGDICSQGNRYSSKIHFVCEKSISTIDHLDLDSNEGI